MSVIVLFNGRRKQLRLGAGTTMSQALQDACEEFGVEPSQHALQHKRAMVDLTQPLRLTGIPQNATIDLVPRPAGAAAGGQVRAGLRLPDGRRLQAVFEADVSLAAMLQSWADAGELDAALLGAGVAMQFMRQSYGAADLSTTTLRSIGLTGGSAMFVLSIADASFGASNGAAAAAAAIPSAASDSEAAERSAVLAAVADAQAAEAAEAAAEAAAKEQGSLRQPAQAEQPPAPPAAPGAMDLSPAAAAAAAAASGPPEPPAPAAISAAAAAATPAVAEHEQQDPLPPELPQMGLQACEAALEAMRGAHFDADSRAAVLTLLKYVDNVLWRPGDARTRSIRCCNAAFRSKVGSITGGGAFLMALGFVAVQEGMSHEIARDPVAHTTLVLSPEREDSSLLRRARALLASEATALGVPDDQLPRPQPPAAAGAAGAAAAAAFDPYRPMRISVSGTPVGSGGPSVTQTRVDELRAKRQALEGVVPDRDLALLLPGATPTAAAAAAAAAASSAMDVEESREDRALVAQRVARQLAERKKLEDVPFQTRAMRELEALTRAKVYSETLIKVQFPDRAALRARFHPKETVGDVAALVREAMAESARGRSFYLYVSPPKTVLTHETRLTDAGLVPAAVIYLGWEKVHADSGNFEYLREDLLAVAGGGGGGGSKGGDSAAAQFPSGVALVPAAEAKENGRGGAGSGSGGGGGGSGGGSSSSRGGSASGKPSWLKLR